MHALTTFETHVENEIREHLKKRHAQLGQLHLPTSKRSLTARNYDSSISALGDYMMDHGYSLPTKSVLEHWRDDMAHGRLISSRGAPFAVKSINARLAAVRKLLNGVADDIVDITVKMSLRDWASIADTKAITKQDKVETDYGRRLTLESLEKLMNSPDISHLKGVRDRALLALLGGAGLRISEAVHVTLRDVFLTENERGQRGILIREGKHGKQRIVVLNDWNSWVIQAVQAYTDALGVTPMTHPDAVIIQGLRRVKGGGYESNAKPLTARNAMEAVGCYEANYLGRMVEINAHDLRRSYAKICKQSGMSWEALRENLGHSSVTITEDYVGHEVDWSERVPNWSIQLKK
jgi:site-specific recombinase XerD